MKIAVLGGRFDPPHIGHFLIASQILELRPDIDRVLLVPAYQHSWKPAVATPLQRMEMLKLLAKDGMEVSDVEIKREGVSYTLDTIKKIKEKTGADIYWIVGSDIIPEFYKWKNPKELVSVATFLVFPRDPYELPKKLPAGFELVTDSRLVVSNISSTIIRNRIKNKMSIKYLVPPEIEKYIQENNLYV